MRRSICQCDPKIAYAGSVNTWKFIYTTATALPKGTNLKFDLGSEGKPHDWQIPSVNSKDKSNLIWLELSDGKVVKAVPVESDIFSSTFEFTLPSDVKATDSVIIYLGTPTDEKKTKGNTSQKHIQRRRSFYLHIDPKGKRDYKEKETFILDIRGNVLNNMRILIPSVVTRNKRFDVVIRFEDKFGNLTCNAPSDTLIELSYDHLRETLNWKLFVPETGFLTLPNLYFNEAGIYKFQLKNLGTGEIFNSSPIKCYENHDISLNWGLLHGESEKTDSSDNLEKCLRYFRDERALQFYATSPFESENKTAENWKNLNTNVSEFNEDDRFITFLGFQWSGEKKSEGLRQLIYSKDNKPLLKSDDAKYNSLSKIYKAFTPKELLSIPCLTSEKNNSFSFDDYNQEFERVVEIYNAWGSSESLSKDGNPKPLQLTKKKTSIEASEGIIQKALANNCRFGFVAGGFDDRGSYSDFYENNKQYSPGLTGIYAKEQTRSSLFDALHNRSCFATTGAEIILELNIAESPMGTELNSKDKPGLELNRHISGFAIGTEKMEKVELIRNGVVIQTFVPIAVSPEAPVNDLLSNYSVHFTFDDLEPLSKVIIKGKKGSNPFIYYYIRVTQTDGHMAWSSPIWVDRVLEKAK